MKLATILLLASAAFIGKQQASELTSADIDEYMGALDLMMSSVGGEVDAAVSLKAGKIDTEKIKEKAK